MWVMRIAIFVVGGMATYMALTIPTIYGLWSVESRQGDSLFILISLLMLGRCVLTWCM